MSLKPINQKGFAAMEAVLVIVIVAILAGTGYYVYHANNKVTDTQNAAQTAAESAAVASTSTKSAVSAGAQAKKVYVNLLQAYDTNGAKDKNWDVKYVDSSAAANEFTKTFKASVDAGTAWPGGVFCTDKYTFEGFIVDRSSLSGDTATVTLSPTVKGKKSSDYPLPIQLTLQYADKRWAIDSQGCLTD